MTLRRLAMDLARRHSKNPFLTPLKRLAAPFVLSGGPTDQWARVVMNRETVKLLDGAEPKGRTTLEISGESWNRPGMFKEYRSVGFPEYDLCDRPLDATFDLIIAEQVFEHLLFPYRAGRNVYRMLNPGGAFLATTPFLLRIHGHPADCTRWTETGMKHFLAECGFPLETIQTGSWGNRRCVVANFKRWQIYQPWRHSLRNEPDYPVVVWALAFKER